MRNDKYKVSERRLLELLEIEEKFRCHSVYGITREDEITYLAETIGVEESDVQRLELTFADAAREKLIDFKKIKEK